MPKLIVHIKKREDTYIYESQTTHDACEAIVAALNNVEAGVLNASPHEVRGCKQDLEHLTNFALNNPELASEQAYWIIEKPVLVKFGKRFLLKKVAGVGYITVAELLDKWSKHRNVDLDQQYINRVGAYLMVF